VDRSKGSPTSAGALRALDPSTGALKWEHKYEGPGWAGTLSTASGVVFSADHRDTFMALDADTGRRLWRHQLGQNVRAAPVTYMIGSRQYVAIASHTLLTVFALS